MPNATWTLTAGCVDTDEEESEYNPKGYWLSNTEINQIFILEEDFKAVCALLLKEYLNYK